LQRFVTRYPGNPQSEDYLTKLLQRQQWITQGTLTPFEEEPDDEAVEPPRTETDVAWLNFAESVRAWAVPIATSAAIDSDRVLPLPNALQQAVTQQRWDADVLAPFDDTAKQEFPLETRVWRYLQAVQTNANAHELEHARQAVQAWLDTEKMNTPNDDKSWLPYLKQYWDKLQPTAPDVLTVGAAWLQDLLDRYRPLPAPVMV